MASVSMHLAHALAARVTDAFGVMGNGNAYLLDALDRTAVRYTAVRHEAGAVVAADAYYRAGGGLAVATTTYGAGFTNAITALAEAAQARIPLLFVVGDAPASGKRPWDVDQRAIAAAVGVPTITVGITDAVAVTLDAIDLALAQRRPVVLSIPYDLANVEAGNLPQLRAPAPPPVVEADPAARATLAEIARRLAGARRPVLLAGRGAWLAGASGALGRLGEIAGAVTVSSALGRGVFPDVRYDIGIAGGFGQQDAMDLIHRSDVAVVFGASLNQFTMKFGALFSSETTLAQLDIGNGATHPRVDEFVHVDARIGAELLVDELERISASPSGWRERVDFASQRARAPGNGVAPDGRLDPRSVATRIGEMLPDDRVVVSDGGHFIGWANAYWPVAEPDRMMMVGTAYQSIGLGLPSVVGAALAKPDSTVVLTTGDGGGLMALADLESAIRVAGGRGIAVVWNDAAYGAELNLYGLKGLAEAPMLIPQVDFARLAEALGAEGVAVDDLDALDRLGEWALELASSRRFLLLDCRISPDVIAPYQHEIIAISQQ
ncbi:MAG TPA: thiamine pyrophosphate-binding protein [Galbitalea sp.]|nr:thiamine pyrophosphate-binding protein [Galbitalea sp.]